MEPIVPTAEITEANLHTDAETGVEMFDDEAATRLVIDDLAAADAYHNINEWAARWTEADEIYQSPVGSSFDGGESHVPSYMVSDHMSALVPKMVEGLFYGDPPFLLRPAPKVPQPVVKAKAALFTFQMIEMGYEEECERSITQMALKGTTVMKWGFLNSKKTVKNYKRDEQPITIDTGMWTHTIHTEESDAFEVEYDEVEVHRPWIRCCDIAAVMPNAGLRVGDIRKAKHVVYRDYATYEDLEDLREEPGYGIPSEEQLREFFITDKTTPRGDNISMTIPENMRGYLQHALPRNQRDSADPLANGLEIIERWDKNRVIVILRHGTDNFCIRNEENPYRKMRYPIPFLSANWRDIPDCFYGQGLGMLEGFQQTTEQGITNMALDLLSKALLPTAIRARGFNTPTQDISLKDGGIIDVEGDIGKAFGFLKWPEPPNSALQWLQNAKSSGASSSGANENFSMGGQTAGAVSTGSRSGTGAQAVIAANASRLDGPAGRFMRQIFIPFIYIMDELNNDLLPTKSLRDSLSQTQARGLEVDHIEFRSAQMEYEVLGGAKLGAKAQMAQFLPFVEQLMINPVIQQMATKEHKKFVLGSFFDAMSDLAGWKFDQPFLVDMTPQEIQQAQAESPSAMQAQKLKAAQDLEQQKFENQSKLQSEMQLEKAGGESIRQITEKALTPELQTGEAGGIGEGNPGQEEI
jgi:hypothetical protein